MYNKSKRWGMIALLTLPLLFSAGIANAAGVTEQSRPQGADWLTSTGDPSQRSVPGNGFGDNGVAGRVATLSVPEPSSLVLFGGALALLGFARAVRLSKRRN